MTQKRELIEEINKQLDTLSMDECAHILSKLNTRDLIALNKAIGEAIKEAKPPIW